MHVRPRIQVSICHGSARICHSLTSSARLISFLNFSSKSAYFSSKASLLDGTFQPEHDGEWAVGELHISHFRYAVRTNSILITLIFVDAKHTHELVVANGRKKQRPPLRTKGRAHPPRAIREKPL